MAVKENVVEQALTVANPEADVHHLTRKISLNPDPIQGQMTVDEVDAHVRNWLQAGYTLHSTHFVGNENGSYVMLYILIK